MCRFLILLGLLAYAVGQAPDTATDVTLDDRQSLDEFLNMEFNKEKPVNTDLDTILSGGGNKVTVPVTVKPVVVQSPPSPVTLRPSQPLVTSMSPPKQQENPCAEGECTPYYQCEDGHIITDGGGIFDVRIDVQECPSSIQTCCSLKSDKPKIPDVQINEGCGFRNAEGVGFRISGAKDGEAQFGEFPWMVAVLKIQKTSDRTISVYQCGGSLIAPNVVLTAAHCVHDKNAAEIKIRAGEWDTQTEDEIFPHQDRFVSEFIIHEHFNAKNLFNDIALIILKEPVRLAENVNTICLPAANENFDNKRCFVSGWGKDQFGKTGVYQVILKRIEVPIVAHDECQTRLRATRLGGHFQLDDSFTCAGGERGRDTCKGDGGSPLICAIPGTINRYVQTGIVAWGIGCNDPIPGVYVNVPHFREWIDTHLDSKHIPKPYNA